ncbi:unnamed protein product [Mytilus coruscus]|uniref:WWE domain-containing protein n=1 Tax=Mytilus coruscus TaxID=42192 RepID=A0A6J8DD82_MYTCO|nr:unnamed protein product [Mytilus coruscus]
MNDQVQWFFKEIDQTGKQFLQEYPDLINMHLENAHRGISGRSDVDFEASGVKYVIDLNTMKEYPVNDPTDTVEVIRREKLKDAETFNLPSKWDDNNDQNLKVITLLNNSQEFMDVEKMFKTSVFNGHFKVQFNASTFKVTKKQNSNRHKLIVVPNEAKTQTFIDKGIFISTNSRCCSDHLVGFNHMSHSVFAQSHTTSTAKTLFTGNNEDTAVLILDGTYIYIQKSSYHKFQKKTYSMHKNRPLVKPMIIVGSDGYILSVLGSYYANAHNNDASITKHLFKTNAEDIKQWIKDDDVLVVDRGFRESFP